MQTIGVEVEDGVRLAVDVWSGEAARPAFVLVHGLASNARLWHAVAHRLAAQGHRVAAVDQRGHGRADKPDHGYDLGTAVGDLVATIAALGWARPVVAGQSWGANVVLELAARHPGAAAAVALVDGGVIELAHRFPTWESCAEALAPPRLEGTPTAEIEAWLRRAHPDWSSDAVEASLANMESTPDGTVRPWLRRDRHLSLLRALWEHRPSQRYAAVDVPVLLVPADSDAPWTADKRAAVAAAAAALPQSSTVWVPGDHDLHAQHPALIADLLAGLARDVAAPTGQGPRS